MRIHTFRIFASGLLAVALGSAATARADYVPCPVKEARWDVTTPLPDPWDFTVQVGTLSEQVGAFINGKEWIICRYAHSPGLGPGHPIQTVFGIASGWGGGEYRLTIHRPIFTNADVTQINCPVPQLKTQLITNVPGPWASTTYVWRQVGKDEREIGGKMHIRCHYASVALDVWKAGPSSILRPLEPDKGPPLAVNPVPKPPKPSDLTTEFAVTGAKLYTAPKVEGNCPVKVRFNGSVAANGKGQVRYRIVHNGAQGSPKKLYFGQAGSRPVSFAFDVGGSTLGSLKVPKPAPAPGSLAAAPTGPDQHAGSARIEILEPRGGVLKSNDANYVVKCVAPKPDRLKAVRPTP
jgi:hypothetical protein